MNIIIGVHKAHFNQQTEINTESRMLSEFRVKAKEIKAYSVSANSCRENATELHEYSEILYDFLKKCNIQLHSNIRL